MSQQPTPEDLNHKSDEETYIFSVSYFKDLDNLHHLVSNALVNSRKCKCPSVNPYTCITWDNCKCSIPHRISRGEGDPRKSRRKSVKYEFLKRNPRSLLSGGSRFSNIHLNKSYFDVVEGKGLFHCWPSNINDSDKYWTFSESVAKESPHQVFFKYLLSKSSCEKIELKSVPPQPHPLLSQTNLSTSFSSWESGSASPASLSCSTPQYSSLKEPDNFGPSACMESDNTYSTEFFIKERNTKESELDGREFESLSPSSSRSSLSSIDHHKNRRCSEVLAGKTCRNQFCYKIHRKPKEDGVYCNYFLKKSRCKFKEECIYKHGSPSTYSKRLENSIDHFISESKNSSRFENRLLSNSEDELRYNDVGKRKSHQKQENSMKCSVNCEKGRTRSSRLDEISSAFETNRLGRKQTKIESSRNDHEKSRNHDFNISKTANPSISSKLIEVSEFDSSVSQSGSISDTGRIYSGTENSNSSVSKDRQTDKSSPYFPLSPLHYETFENVLNVKAFNHKESSHNLDTELGNVDSDPCRRGEYDSPSQKAFMKGSTDTADIGHELNVESNYSDGEDETPFYSGMGLLLSALKSKGTNLPDENLERNSTKSNSVSSNFIENISKSVVCEETFEPLTGSISDNAQVTSPIENFGENSDVSKVNKKVLEQESSVCNTPKVYVPIRKSSTQMTTSVTEESEETDEVQNKRNEGKSERFNNSDVCIENLANIARNSDIPDSDDPGKLNLSQSDDEDNEPMYSGLGNLLSVLKDKENNKPFIHEVSKGTSTGLCKNSEVSSKKISGYKDVLNNDSHDFPSHRAASNKNNSHNPDSSRKNLSHCPASNTKNPVAPNGKCKNEQFANNNCKSSKVKNDASERRIKKNIPILKSEYVKPENSKTPKYISSVKSKKLKISNLHNINHIDSTCIKKFSLKKCSVILRPEDKIQEKIVMKFLDYWKRVDSSDCVQKNIHKPEKSVPHDSMNTLNNSREFTFKIKRNSNKNGDSSISNSNDNTQIKNGLHGELVHKPKLHKQISNNCETKTLFSERKIEKEAKASTTLSEKSNPKSEGKLSRVKESNTKKGDSVAGKPSRKMDSSKSNEKNKRNSKEKITFSTKSGESATVKNRDENFKQVEQYKQTKSSVSSKSSQKVDSSSSNNDFRKLVRNGENIIPPKLCENADISSSGGKFAKGKQNKEINKPALPKLHKKEINNSKNSIDVELSDKREKLSASSKLSEDDKKSVVSFPSKLNENPSIKNDAKSKLCGSSNLKKLVSPNPNPPKSRSPCPLRIKSEPKSPEHSGFVSDAKSKLCHSSNLKKVVSPNPNDKSQPYCPLRIKSEPKSPDPSGTVKAKKRLNNSFEDVLQYDKALKLPPGKVAGTKSKTHSTPEQKVKNSTHDLETTTLCSNLTNSSPHAILTSDESKSHSFKEVKLKSSRFESPTPVQKDLSDMKSPKLLDKSNQKRKLEAASSPSIKRVKQSLKNENDVAKKFNKKNFIKNIKEKHNLPTVERKLSENSEIHKTNIGKSTSMKLKEASDPMAQEKVSVDRNGVSGKKHENANKKENYIKKSCSKISTTKETFERQLSDDSSTHQIPSKVQVDKESSDGVETESNDPILDLDEHTGSVDYLNESNSDIENLWDLKFIIDIAGGFLKSFGKEDFNCIHICREFQELCLVHDIQNVECGDDFNVLDRNIRRFASSKFKQLHGLPSSSDDIKMHLTLKEYIATLQQLNSFLSTSSQFES